MFRHQLMFYLIYFIEFRIQSLLIIKPRFALEDFKIARYIVSLLVRCKFYFVADVRPCSKWDAIILQFAARGEVKLPNLDTFIIWGSLAGFSSLHHLPFKWIFLCRKI